jgi:hypothetical protein
MVVVVVSAIPVPPSRADHGESLGGRTPFPRLHGSLIPPNNPTRLAGAETPTLQTTD